MLMLGGIFAAVPGCLDDELWYSGDGSEGMAIVNLEARFSPFAGNELSRGSNVYHARGFNTISDIAILVFSASDGKLVDMFAYDNNDNDNDNNFTESSETRDPDATNNGASNGRPAETDTKKVTDLRLKIPFGNYYIVAVANYGDYISGSEGNIQVIRNSYTKLNEKIKSMETGFSLDDLLHLRVNWDTEDYANNRAMLGYFDVDGKAPSAQSTFATVNVDRPGISLSAWLRRCVSKVTVDFDGSSLSDNVSIYIKDVRIYDVPKECTLGFGYPDGSEGVTDANNHPGRKYSSPDDMPGNPQSILAEGVFATVDENNTDGTYIEFGEGTDYTTWPCITRHSPDILKDKDGSRHSQEAECLYFYENMQNANLNGTRPDRAPVPDLDNGGFAEGYNFKNQVPFGTYIEVTAHHVSEIGGQREETDIKYRFILGKNVTDDYDAERNYHYKLTLQFLGKANEHHWHIDYDRTVGFKVPNPWYVSYLYNHDAYLPFEFNIPDDGKNWKIKKMEAEIEKNPWYPTTSSKYAEGVDTDLADPKIDINPITPVGDDNGNYTNPYLEGDNKYTGNGFLALRFPSDESVLTDVQATGSAWSGYSDANKTINQNYFDGKVNGVNYGKRTIIENDIAADSRSDREKINVKKERGEYAINIPLFTREKALVKQTGYTGNNPFVGYQRMARIRLNATIVNADDENDTIDYTAKVNVIQVRRVVNPKGVYRKSGNYEPFHVNLKFLTSEDASGKFQSIKSRGPWRAEILGDQNFITLDGKQRVSGTSGKEIDFTIRFNRMGGTGNKNAIVRIKYHNFTCTHLIFVRQGYAAQTLSPAGKMLYNPEASPTKWNTFNMIGGDKMADDPRDEGSLFKYGNPDDAISSSSNIYTDEAGNPLFHELRSDQFKPHPTLTILKPDGTVNPEKTAWTSIPYKNEGQTDYLSGFSDAKSMEISNAATIRDFEQLYLTKNIEFGYGILYADGATETQETLEMANGWYRDDTSADKNSKGMRGVFAYFWNVDNTADSYNGRNLFFPIGRAGYGHRKDTEKYGWAPNETIVSKNSGTLRYASLRPYSASQCGTTSFVNVAPLFEFLYRRMGAIYWARKPKVEYLPANGIPTNCGKDNNGVWNNIPCALDFNYFSFDVDALNENNLNVFADACFVRTVEITADPNPNSDH